MHHQSQKDLIKLKDSDLNKENACQREAAATIHLKTSMKETLIQVLTTLNVQEDAVNTQTVQPLMSGMEITIASFSSTNHITVTELGKKSASSMKTQYLKDQENTQKSNGVASLIIIVQNLRQTNIVHSMNS